MNDKNKTCLSFFSLASMFVLPVISLAVGWIGWDFKVGAIAALATFAVFFLISGGVLSTVTNLSWIAVSLPFIAGAIYSVLPDFIPLPFDDAIVLASGSLMTFSLWLKKQPDAPKWIIFPLLLASVYTLVGSVIPGPVDELLVMGIGSGVSIYGSRKQLSSNQLVNIPQNNGLPANVVEGEIRKEEDDLQVDKVNEN